MAAGLVFDAGGGRELRFALSDGSEWSIPLLASLNARDARGLMDAVKSAGDDATGVMVDFVDAKCPGLIDKVSLGTLNDIVAAWMEASQADAAGAGTPGE